MAILIKPKPFILFVLVFSVPFYFHHFGNNKMEKSKMGHGFNLPKKETISSPSIIR